jgi:hypothetical protein
MTSQADRDRRKAMVRGFKQRERQAADAQMPLSRDELAALFDHLDETLAEGCDHSLRFTKKFLAGHSLSEELIIPWLRDHGGYCDCEVLANVENAGPRDR